MSEINTGGPAFPCDLTAYDAEVVQEFQGMTLRDYFAAKVIEGSIARDGMPRGDTKQFLADQAYEMANAMLKAREK